MLPKTEHLGSSRPNEIVPPSFEDIGEESITKAIETFNSIPDLKTLDYFLRENNVEMSPNGVCYAIVGPEGKSQTEAILVPTPFANTMTDNMLERAYFLSKVVEEEGIADSDGNILPVIMVASPGIGGSKMHFTKEELAEIRSGNLGVYAKELLRAIELIGVGRLAITGAFSQGADIALASHKHAPSANIDITRLAVGDPAGVVNRGFVELGRDFMATGPKDLKQTLGESGLHHKGDSINSSDFARFALSAITSPVNRALWQGLSHDNFEKTLIEILNSPQVADKITKSVVVGYGENSSIARPEHIEPALQRATEQDLMKILYTMRVKNANHTWGDNLPLLSLLIARAFNANNR